MGADDHEVARACGRWQVTLRTTYLSDTLRISRPVLELDGAPASGTDDDGSRAIFVYARA